MHMVIKALREQAQPTLAKIKASEKISPQELKDATEMYELAYYLRKFDDMEPEEESGKDQDDDNDLMSHLRDELDGAEEYYGLWLQTRVPEYKMMAQQELSHAEFWMKQARQSGIPQAELASYITRHGSLTTSLT